MTALLYIPIVISLVVLGAHFLRDGNGLGVFAALALLGLLFVRRAWVAKLVQVALILGTMEWIWTLYTLADMRAAQGVPAMRMAVILGVVAVFTLGSALLSMSYTSSSVR